LLLVSEEGQAQPQRIVSFPRMTAERPSEPCRVKGSLLLLDLRDDRGGCAAFGKVTERRHVGRLLGRDFAQERQRRGSEVVPQWGMRRRNEGRDERPVLLELQHPGNRWAESFNPVHRLPSTRLLSRGNGLARPLPQCGLRGRRDTDEREAAPSSAPREFLWQYVYSTPLAAATPALDDGSRAELEREVVEAWKPFTDEGNLMLELEMAIAKGLR
jgi:hypothetical protein